MNFAALPTCKKTPLVESAGTLSGWPAGWPWLLWVVAAAAAAAAVASGLYLASTINK